MRDSNRATPVVTRGFVSCANSVTFYDKQGQNLIPKYPFLIFYHLEFRYLLGCKKLNINKRKLKLYSYIIQLLLRHGIFVFGRILNRAKLFASKDKRNKKTQRKYVNNIR